MNGNLMRRAAISVLVVGWLFAVLVGYYVIHKPITIESFVAVPGMLGHVFGVTAGETLGALANVVGDAGTVLCVVVLAAALGHRLMGAWTFETALEEIVLWTGIGLGALGLIVFGLALAGIVQRWAGWILVVAGFGLVRNDLRAVFSTLRAVSCPRPTRGDTALAVFCAMTLALTLLFSLTPPWGWDGLQYHLVAPKLILEQGRVTTPPDNFSLNFPSLVEMLFLAGMILKGDGATQALHWVFLPLTMGAMLVFAARYYSWRVGWIACAVLCAVPTVALISTWAYNDLALVFFTFAAFMMLLRARSSEQKRDFLLVGILCGLALGEKYTAALIPIVLAAFVIRPNRRAIQNAALIIAGAVVVSAPWFLRNWVLVGNPFYPYVFGGVDWDAFRTAWNTRLGTGLWNRPLELLAVPWTATIAGAQSGLYDATLGPLLLALVPLNLIPERAPDNAAHAPTRAVWIFVAVLYVVWLAGVAESNILWQSRLLLPAFPFLCLLAARGLEKLGGVTLTQFSIQRFASMVVGIVLALTALSYTLAFLTDSALGYFFGAVTRQEYLTGVLGAHYETAVWVNANLPAGSRVLFLWEPRTYYFARDAEADAILDRFTHLNYLYGDADKMADQLRKEGFTHVLLYREGLDNILQTGFDPISNANVETLDEFVTKDLKPIYGAPSLGLETRNGRFGLANAQQEPYAVYELKAP